VKIEVPVIPVGKPRMTRQDKWMKRPAVLRYRAFEDAIVAHTTKIRFCLPDSGCGITFTLPMPQSWSMRKRIKMNGRPHQQKPDIDNLLKAVMDSLRGEDCTVWNVERLAKVWGETGSITFEVQV
jgi:Holliday junction resolvase RusA-like endonuclease